ncbi:MAG: hypothetical protein ABSF44_16365 [Candidatus Bathyarchaeia archaeon]|jgi:hypothetical protein
MVNQFSSQEVHGDYPAGFNVPNYHPVLTESEELWIEKANARIRERDKQGKMSARQRCGQSQWGPGPVDRVPMALPAQSHIIPRIFDSYLDNPPILTNRDLLKHPNLYFLAETIWRARFYCDWIYNSPVSFGEDILTKQFRLIDNGPPLAVEGFAKTKEDMEYFYDNVPDPAASGTWPIHLWLNKMRVKTLPELPSYGSACAGHIASAGFFMGIKEFLLAVRKNPELAILATKCVTKFINRKIDIMADVIGQQLNADGVGNMLYWCDGAGGFLTGAEFKLLFDEGYGASITHSAKKGYAPCIAFAGPVPSMELMCDHMGNLLGGGQVIGETPPYEDLWPVLHKYDNMYTEANSQNKTLLANDPEAAIRKDLGRLAALQAKTKLPRMMLEHAIDVLAPLPMVDLLIKLSFEIFTYPIKA